MIVFATTCKGRAQHIEQTLPKNLTDNPEEFCRFLLLNYNSPDGLLPYLVDNHKDALKSGKLTLYNFPADGPFHMAHAKNMAHRLGIVEGADILVTLDADNFAGAGFGRFVADKFAQDPVGMYLCPKFGPSNKGKLPRGYAGRLAVRPQDFIKAGGFNEKYDTWCGEDMDFNARMDRMGYAQRYIDVGYLDAVRHGADVRFKEWPHARQYENDQVLKDIQASSDTVVNWGQFGLGTAFKNFDSMPITLGSVPTRIFGIGMQKTATTSLHKAFQIFGYDSLHWGSGEAPMIWNEMNAVGRSKTLERWYSLCDMPIPLLYSRLDKAYPGSKFILTIRDEAKWVKSVERLWDAKYNPTRWTWDTWPISNQLHQAMYGRTDFDATTMLECYRKHNAEVREHFKGRPSDLLVMNMDAGAGWRELCGFLGKPIPAVPYPIEYVTKEAIS